MKGHSGMDMSYVGTMSMPHFAVPASKAATDVLRAGKRLGEGFTGRTPHTFSQIHTHRMYSLKTMSTSWSTLMSRQTTM